MTVEIVDTGGMGISSPRVDDGFLEAATAAITEGVVGFESDGAIVFANRAAEELLGYEPGGLLECSLEELIPADQSRAFATLEREVESDPTATAELSFRREDGQRVPVVAGVKTVDADRESFVTSFRERSTDEGESDGAPGGIRSFLDHTPDAAAVVDARSETITAWNDRFRDLVGYGEEAAPLEPATLHPAHADDFRTFVDRTVEEGAARLGWIAYRTKRGDTVDARISASTVELSGRPHALVTVHEASGPNWDAYDEEFEAAESATAIGRLTVDLVESVLDRSPVAVWIADETSNGLRVVAASDDHSSDREPTAAETAAYAEGTATVVDGDDALENGARSEGAVRQRLVVPLGAYGVLTVGSTDDDLDESVRERVETLAERARTALHRVSETRLAHQRAAVVDATIDGIAITNEDGLFTYVNRVYSELFGYDEPDALVGRSWRQLFDRDEIERYESEVLPVIAERGSWRGEATGRSRTGEAIALEISLSTLEDGSAVCIARDVTERTRQKRQLEALNDVARKLIRADDREEICRIGIEALEEVLALNIACLRLFDDDAQRLECVALTPDAEALLETRTAYDLEATLAGHAFREAETVVYRVPSEPSNWSATGYSSFHVPMGSYGVFSVVVPGGETFGDRDVHLAEMLSVNVRTALARAQRVRLLRSHEREVRQQRDHLETHNRINRLIQEIGRRLTEATTREELEQTICDHLANSELYHSAWIGDVETSTDRVTTRAGSGIAERDFEAIGEMAISSIGHGSVERAIETGSIEAVRHYQLEERRDGAAAEAVEAARSTAAIPLTYGDRLFGVLVVNSTAEDAFGEETFLGFESLGKVAGFAINAIGNRKLLLSDSVVELEFAITDRSDFYHRASSDLDCEFRFERSVPLEAGTVLNYHAVRGADPASVLSAAAEADAIEDARVLGEESERFLLQTLASTSAVHVALHAGATLRSADVVAGEARLVLEAPQTANVRRLVSSLEEAFDGVELVAKREHDRPIQTAGEFRRAVEQRLTEKQRSAIESAYVSGYYDWPRSITAEELAESMGISSSTLHQHLRKGVWSLLSAFLDERREGEGGTVGASSRAGRDGNGE
ncbi:bacterio-opsin activator domain-containing protein [Natrarchaeobius sp. A-rgal3]|uniref:bacterio-opsin activator domain-containing protein n=1 Tax=Natrarchaeobius versutus TaxID=1679078 RepID=UPI00350FD4CB